MAAYKSIPIKSDGLTFSSTGPICSLPIRSVTNTPRQRTSPMTAKTFFTGTTHNVPGANGSTRSADGFLDLKLPQPHPAAENLFGAAWSACYQGAIELVAAQKKIALPE